MTRDSLLDHLPLAQEKISAGRIALTHGDRSLSYSTLSTSIRHFCGGLMSMGLARSERVAVYLDKRFENGIACFGAAAAGAVFVPVNPLLKPDQVGHILRDSNARVLVTSPERQELLEGTLASCPELRHVIVVGEAPGAGGSAQYAVHAWAQVLQAPSDDGHRVIDTDMAAILYTSGSTGQPKGVVLSHRNMVTGAKSVAQYLENDADDTLLAVLPLSFDAGFSQLTTAFCVGARVVLLNYLLPKDVTNALVKERVSGLTAVPPLYIQLARMPWPSSITEHLRYFANTGGRMPLEVLKALRERTPQSRPFLMYGLTEAFRSTYLPPEQIDRRPDSIGKAIPNAEILVLREDGTPCAAGEPGELVHRGALVAMGYWNDAEKTAERFRPLPGREPGLVLPELAVFSGDTVRADDEGFLYFVGRRDEMIKTSGYRVSPAEIEELLYATKLVGETAAFGVPHPTLGQGIVVVATHGPHAPTDEPALLAECKRRLPAYMVPSRIDLRDGPLPRNPNGKIDRKTLAAEYYNLFDDS